MPDEFEAEAPVSAPHPAHVRLATVVIVQIEKIVLDAEQQTRPLEMPPYRDQLFDLFVQAWEAGLTTGESEPDLSSDGITKALAERWGLAAAARDSFQQQAKLPPQQLNRLRLLWSCLRMWMEWSYAWQRWADYHPDERAADDSL